LEEEVEEDLHARYPWDDYTGEFKVKIRALEDLYIQLFLANISPDEIDGVYDMCDIEFELELASTPSIIIESASHSTK
jgi:hypothetical protein